MATSIQFRLGQQTYLFNLKIGFFLLSLIFFLLLCMLGVWQLHRYQEKKVLLSQYHTRLTEPYQPLSPDSSRDLQFQRVSASGQFEENQTVFVQTAQQGRLGYEVFTPFRLLNHKELLLVDRGWLPKENQKAIPKIEVTQIQGYLKRLEKSYFMLGKNIYDTKASPLIMQRIDLDELKHLTGQTFFPYILRLEVPTTDQLTRHWIISAITPEKHLGYAIQWFLMAMVLLIAYLCFSCERVKHDDTINA